ncbi:U-scoloptoxin(19)-Sm1a [Toxorhynchites rutilus septentrionalis]|uniref:U-scoloptoxin(19)-Sm1a n=1 Tax=Toxorhynchites rutilus septentrionalis TaxID=329112 RepID=UPI00247A36EE|nr:U-scoloptoxin(19)-Sm1a [Toxorhynchites rutilus septentrionalis]
MKSNIILVFLFVAFVCAANGSKIRRSLDPENGDIVGSYLGKKMYTMEAPCARQGGACVHKADCQELTAQSGLCPKNAHRGVECCHRVIPQRGGLTCSEHLGECMKDCKAVVLMRPAKDCEADETCCVLV